MAMNCFEARQDFASLWRESLDPARRAELITHLAECAKCDRAFRVFALSAPALHSERVPEPGTSRVAGRRPSPRQIARPRRWFAMCAAITFFVAAGLAAWMSVTMPVESLSDTLDVPDNFIQQVFGPDLAPPPNDLAG